MPGYTMTGSAWAVAAGRPGRECQDSNQCGQYA